MKTRVTSIRLLHLRRLKRHHLVAAVMLSELTRQRCNAASEVLEVPKMCRKFRKIIKTDFGHYAQSFYVDICPIRQLGKCQNFIITSFWPYTILLLNYFRRLLPGSVQ